MKKGIVNLKKLSSLERDGEVMYVAITDELNYTMVLKVMEDTSDLIHKYYAITCINGKYYETEYDSLREAQYQAAVETIKYTM